MDRHGWYVYVDPWVGGKNRKNSCNYAVQMTKTSGEMCWQSSKRIMLHSQVSTQVAFKNSRDNLCLDIPTIFDGQPQQRKIVGN